MGKGILLSTPPLPLRCYLIIISNDFWWGKTNWRANWPSHENNEIKSGSLHKWQSLVSFDLFQLNIIWCILHLGIIIVFTHQVFYKIYQTICPRTDIDDVYKTISKTETISASKLIEFLNEKQRDARLNQILYPEYDQKRVGSVIEVFPQP